MSRRTRIQLSILVITVVTAATPLLAVQASRQLGWLEQPDGTRFQARQWGDEWLSGWETADGYSIVLDEATGSWRFAERAPGGRLVASGLAVGRDVLPDGWPTGLRPEGVVVAQAYELRGSAQTPRDVTAAAIAGTANVPVALITFADRETGYASQAFEWLLFGPSNDSAAAYYREVSYGRFGISSGPAGVMGWFKAYNDHDYYGEDQGNTKDYWHADLVYEAAVQADLSGVRFGSYDRDGDCYVDVFAVIFKGQNQANTAYGAPNDIWPKQWYLEAAYAQGRAHHGVYETDELCHSGGKIKVDRYIIQSEQDGPQMARIGTFAHEYAHGLDALDLYDYGYDSSGVGMWSLMAAGSDARVSLPGDRPSHLDPWHKARFGWLVPQPVSGTLDDEQISSAATAADVYQLLSGDPNCGCEYYLVENRQQTGFDAGLPGSGLLIWHIDENVPLNGGRINENQCYPGGPSCATQHYRVAVVQADGLWELERNLSNGDFGDPFPGSTNNTAFSPISNPNSNFYSGAASSVSVTEIASSGVDGSIVATLSITSSDCLYSITPTSQSFSAASGTGSVSVTASGTNCPWTASSGASWVTITGGSSGTGNGTVTYSVAANSSTTPRSGTLTIAELTFTVSQTAGGATCTAPTIAAHPASTAISAGATATLTVTATGTTPLSYQWYRGLSGDTTNAITSATASSFTTPSLTSTTTYWVQVTNSCGSVNSNAATVTVSGGGTGTYTYFVPSVAHAAGANNTQWRTDLSIVNRNPSTASMTLEYIGATQLSASHSIGPWSTFGWRDVLVSLFWSSTAAKGVVKVTSNLPLAIVARTYNASGTGTQGQSYPALQVTRGITQGQVAILPHITGNAEFRSNVGFLNLGSESCSVTVKLFGTTGTQLGNSLPYTVAPTAYGQIDKVNEQAAAGTVELAYATVEVNTPGCRIWTCAAVVDQVSADPTTIEMIVP